jgi:hypothetical protein
MLAACATGPAADNAAAAATPNARDTFRFIFRAISRLR